MDFDDDFKDRVHHFWFGGRREWDEEEEDYVFTPEALCNNSDPDEDVYTATPEHVTCEQCKLALSKQPERHQ